MAVCGVEWVNSWRWAFLGLGFRRSEGLMRVERCYGSRICEFIGGVWGCIGIHPGGGGRVRYGAGGQAVVEVFVAAAAAAFGLRCSDVYVGVFLCVHGFRC